MALRDGLRWFDYERFYAGGYNDRRREPLARARAGRAVLRVGAFVIALYAAVVALVLRLH